MKKKGFLLCLVLILTMMTSAAFAQEDINVRIDSTNVEFNEEIGRPFIDENNRTMVPFRAVLEAYGADVQWDGATRTAKSIMEDITIEVPIGEKYIVMDGEKIENDTASIIKDNKTYLPITKVMEGFGTDVQWDKKLGTVVITTESFDAKGKIIDAYEKSYAWENYDMDILMNMSMTVPDETGNIQEMDMQMDMNATAFMNPMKLKADANMIMEVAGMEISQPLMEMYMVTEDDKFITYTSMVDPMTGETTWLKEEVEDEGFAKLVDPNNEEIQSLNEESIKEANYLGSYDDGDRKLDKYEVTITFEGFDEIMKQSMSLVTGSLTDEDLQMSLDLISNLDDMSYILYIDEATEEFAKLEMDLTSMLNSMFEQIMDSTAVEIEDSKEITEEELEEFNNEILESMKTMDIEADIVGEYLNINNAEDFEIPEEASDAITTEEYLEELEELMEVPEEVTEEEATE